MLFSSISSSDIFTRESQPKRFKYAPYDQSDDIVIGRNRVLKYEILEKHDVS